MRLCPVCASENRELLHTLQLTSGEWQNIYCCIDCGMGYTSLSKAVDYADDSIYVAPNAVGSGATTADRNRLVGTAKIIAQLEPCREAAILDVGCAQGGLLTALWEEGFRNLRGLDPSPICAQMARDAGHLAAVGTLEIEAGQYDLIILSHVLEHVEDPISLLKVAKSRLTASGHLYIEVPDASCYNNPFLDFNAEHINHFDYGSLANCANFALLRGARTGQRSFLLADKSAYRAEWIWVDTQPIDRKLAPTSTAPNLRDYIDKSKRALATINIHLEQQLKGEPNLILWGAGSYLGNVLALPAIKARYIVAIVDSNPALKGKVVAGRAIMSSQGLEKWPQPEPILITSLLAIKSIKADIARMGLVNKVITL